MHIDILEPQNNADTQIGHHVPKLFDQGPSGPYKSICLPLTASALGLFCRLKLLVLEESVRCQQQPCTHLFLLYLCHQHCPFTPEKIVVTELKCRRGSAGKWTVWGSCTEQLDWESCKTRACCHPKCRAGMAQPALPGAVRAPGRERTVVFYVVETAPTCDL